MASVSLQDVYTCALLPVQIEPKKAAPEKHAQIPTTDARWIRCKTFANLHAAVFVSRKPMLYLTNGGCVRDENNQKHTAAITVWKREL